MAFSADMLEPIDGLPIDMKPGFIVVIINKSDKDNPIYTMALPDSFGNIYFANNHHIFDIEDFDNEEMDSGDYKIIKVYGYSSHSDFIFFDQVNNRKLLYDAEVKKMTEKEIEEKLGYKIEIVD